jgi:hypothetical protein
MHKQPLSIHSHVTAFDQPYKKVSDISEEQETVNQFFHKYSQSLLESSKCSSVELIQGPIFSKQSKYSGEDA